MGKAEGKMKAIVLIPVRDEGDALEQLLPSVKRALRMTEVPIRALVLNDGSSDESGEVARKNGFECLDLPPRGKAQAVKRGFQFALKHSYQYVLVFDGDGQHPAWVIPQMIGLLDKHCIVKGTRFDYGSPQIGTPMDREVLNVATRALITKYTGWNITDPQCGLIGMHREMVREILPLLQWEDEWEMEFLLRYSQKTKVSPVHEFEIPAIYAGLPGAKQVAKYHIGNGLDRLTRLDRQVRFIYRIISEMNDLTSISKGAAAS